MKTSNVSDAGRPKMPRWVKVSGIIVITLILLMVIAMFFGGNHGPGRHMPSKSQEVQ